MAYCKVCKEEIVEGSKFCVKCGTPIETREKERTNADEQTGSLDKQQGEIGIVQTINEENVPHLATNTVLENKDTKKSKKKLMIGILSAGVVGVLAIIAVVLLLVFNKTAKVDIGSFVLVEYSGYDTIGEAIVKIDEDELIEAVADSLEKDEDDVADDIRRLVESFSYEISGNGELVNGEEIDITINYNHDKATKNRLELVNTKVSFIVENLEDPANLDVFKELKEQYKNGVVNNETKEMKIDFRRIINEMVLKQIEGEYEGKKEIKLSNLTYFGSYYMECKEDNMDRFTIVVYKATISSENFIEREFFIPIKVSNIECITKDKLIGDMKNVGSCYRIGENDESIGYLTIDSMCYDLILSVNDNYDIQPDGDILKIGSIKLESNNSEIHNLMLDYIQFAYEELNESELEKCVEDINNIDWEVCNIRNSSTEYYKNLKCYTIESAVENIYIVFIIYDRKFYAIESDVVTGEIHFVKKNEDGSYIIANKISKDKQLDYIDQNVWDVVKTIFFDIGYMQKYAIPLNEKLAEMLIN